LKFVQFAKRIKEMSGVVIAEMFPRVPVDSLQETRQTDASDPAKVLRGAAELRRVCVPSLLRLN
jgi:hypothetical protein